MINLRSQHKKRLLEQIRDNEQEMKKTDEEDRIMELKSRNQSLFDMVHLVDLLTCLRKLMEK